MYSKERFTFISQHDAYSIDAEGFDVSSRDTHQTSGAAIDEPTVTSSDYSSLSAPSTSVISHDLNGNAVRKFNIKQLEEQLSKVSPDDLATDSSCDRKSTCRQTIINVFNNFDHVDIVSIKGTVSLHRNESQADKDANEDDESNKEEDMNSNI